MKTKWLRRLVNFWPPFFLNSIQATYISEDFREVTVELKLRLHNRNYVGVHFGGNLFSMTDAWYMLMLMQNLGREYYVWDKKATIDFVAPGRGTVVATFKVTEQCLQEIRERTAKGDKYLPEFHVEIKDKTGNLVARVHKTIYVKRKT